MPTLTPGSSVPYICSVVIALRVWRDVSLGRHIALCAWWSSGLAKGRSTISVIVQTSVAGIFCYMRLNSLLSKQMHWMLLICSSISLCRHMGTGGTMLNSSAYGSLVHCCQLFWRMIGKVVITHWVKAATIVYSLCGCPASSLYSPSLAVHDPDTPRTEVKQKQK